MESVVLILPIRAASLHVSLESCQTGRQNENLAQQYLEMERAIFWE